MMYLLTEQEHAQIVDALEAAVDVPCYGGHPRQEAALAMLKAMDATLPSAWLACDQYGNVGCSTKENHALRCCEAGTKAEPLYAKEQL